MKDKVVVITGAAMGLGFAVAKELASRGSKLVLVDYNEEKLNEANDAILKDFPETKTLLVSKTFF